MSLQQYISIHIRLFFPFSKWGFVFIRCSLGKVESSRGESMRAKTEKLDIGWIPYGFTCKFLSALKGISRHSHRGAQTLSRTSFLCRSQLSLFNLSILFCDLAVIKQ